MSYYTDVANIKAFEEAEADTLQAVGRVAKAVDALTRAVHGLDVSGEYAETWKRAVVTFERTSQQCKRNVEQLAAAVATHGRNTDTANTAAAESYQRMAKGADGLV